MENNGTFYIGAQSTQNTVNGIIKKESSFEDIEFYIYTIGGDAGFCIVTPEMLERIEMTAEEAWKQAEDNTRAQITLQSLGEAIGLSDDESGVYVLSTRVGYGAGSLAVTDLKKLAEKCGTKTVAMLPSSVFEVLLWPGATASEEELSQMVRDVNAQEMAETPQDILGQRAYVMHF